MSDATPIDTNLVLAMLRALRDGDTGPSIAEMRRDPALAALLRSDAEMGPIKAALLKAIRAPGKLTCLAPHPPGCAAKPIRSHSIGRAGPIRELADPTNHVLMFDMRMSFEERPVAGVKRVGINDATTFPGLCSKHDTDLFRPIDVSPLETPTAEQLFLLSYRALLRELHAKRVQARGAKEQARLVGRANASPEAAVVAIAIAYDTYLGEFHLNHTKRIYDGIFKTRAYDRFLRFVTRRTRRVPFAVSSLFTPSHDLSGAAIERPARTGPLPFMTLDVLPDSNGTLVTLAVPRWHEAALRGIVDALGDDENVFLERIWELTLRNCENLVIAPAAWAALDHGQAGALERFFTATVHGGWVPSPRIPLPYAGSVRSSDVTPMPQHRAR